MVYVCIKGRERGSVGEGRGVYVYDIVYNVM